MSAPAVRVQPVRNPVLPAGVTPEQRYWRGYKQSKIIQPNNSVNHIHFNPTNPHDFAVTTASSVSIFSSRTLERTKNINRFDDVAYSGEFRADGKLLIAGDGSGKVRVFDVKSRNILLTLQPTKNPTHVTKFHPTSLTSFLSASDDRIVRLWDLTSPDPVATFEGHKGYVRTASFIPSSSLISTGCYDEVVRIFDPRTSSTEPVTSYNVEAPIDSLLAINPTTLISASGPIIQVWDIAAGKRIKKLSYFQNTVTCLANAYDRGILAGSLDGHVKVIDSNSPSWDVKFGWKFSGPVLSADVSPDFKHLVTGSKEVFSVRTRKTEVKKKAAMIPTVKSGNFARMIRGAEYHGEMEHNILNDKPKPLNKLKTYEKHINAFRWGDALDAAFSKGMTPEMTITVLEELKKRGKVSISLSSRDEDSLEPILKWCVKAVQDIRAAPIIADWVGCIVDLYGVLIDKSPILENLITELSRKVKLEIETAKEAKRIEGMLEMLLSR